MFAPKSVSRGVAGSYTTWVLGTVEYTTWVSIGVYIQYLLNQSFPFISRNRKQCLRGQGSLSILMGWGLQYSFTTATISRKAMFAPKSVSRGVAGSYCWVDYMGKGNYSICSIFPLQQRFSRPKLFGNTNFPYFSVSAILNANVAFRKLRTPTDIVWMLLYTLPHTLPLLKAITQSIPDKNRTEWNRMNPWTGLDTNRNGTEPERTASRFIKLFSNRCESMRTTGTLLQRFKGFKRIKNKN